MMDKEKDRCKSSKKRNNKLIIIKIIIIIFVLVLMFFCFIHPYIWKFFVPEKTTEGIEVFRNETYLQFEGGYDFRNYLEKVPWIDPEEADNFLHDENAAADSLIYGKAPDVFVLEFYDKPVETVESYLTGEEWTFGGWINGEVAMYIMSPELTDGEYRVMIMLNQNTGKVRFMMFTRSNVIDNGMEMVQALIAFCSGIDWTK